MLDIVYGTLLNEEREEISAEENEKHTVKWIEKKQLSRYININNNIYVIDKINTGDKAYELEEGKMINSRELDKLDLLEARNIVKNRI